VALGKGGETSAGPSPSSNLHTTTGCFAVLGPDGNHDDSDKVLAEEASVTHPATGSDGAPGAAVVVTVVHSPACHLCEDAERALAELAETHPLVIDRVDIRSDRGQALVREHRPPMSPLVLLDGAFFGFGRLSRRKLAKVLDQRPATRATAAAGSVPSDPA